MWPPGLINLEQSLRSWYALRCTRGRARIAQRFLLMRSRPSQFCFRVYNNAESSVFTAWLIDQDQSGAGKATRVLIRAASCRVQPCVRRLRQLTDEIEPAAESAACHLLSGTAGHGRKALCALSVHRCAADCGRHRDGANPSDADTIPGGFIMIRGAAR